MWVTPEYIYVERCAIDGNVVCDTWVYMLKDVDCYMYDKMSHELYYSTCHKCIKSTDSKDDIKCYCYLPHVWMCIAYELKGRSTVYSSH